MPVITVAVIANKINVIETLMKVALISRSTLYRVPGGDTVQITSMAKYLEALGIAASIRLTHEQIDYDEYDLLHFFNLTRPADIMHHLQKTAKPYVASPNLVRYCEYDRRYRKGLAGLIFRFLRPEAIEYIKTVARWINGSDTLNAISYLRKGQKQSIQQILSNAALVLPNSGMENTMLEKLYGITSAYSIIPNGIDTNIFTHDNSIKKDVDLVLCVARIEGIKNQLNLIKALNNTRFKLLVIGSYTENQKRYYSLCKRIAAPNIYFIEQISQHELVEYYKKAKVHILPSWFETCGLSTLEAAAMGCNVVVTDRGYTREYFENYALYCDPASPQSIFETVQQASIRKQQESFRMKIMTSYTWQLAASRTAQAYHQTMHTPWD